jgi:NTE family protein
MKQAAQPTTAFVLSGGASLGALQVGMLQALFAAGVAPDFIVATSVGALNGAFIAARPPTPQTADELEELWLSVHRGNVFPFNPLTGFFGFAGVRRNFVSSDPLRSLIAEHLTFDRIEQLVTPLHVIAAEAQTGQERRLSAGPLLDAVLASAAIPGVFAPVDWDGELLMDGGVANNTPISHAVEMGAERIYVLSTGQVCELERPPRGAVGMLVHGLTLLMNQRLAADVALHRGQAELVVLPVPCPLTVHPMDFSHSAELIARAREEAKSFLAGRRKTYLAPVTNSVSHHQTKEKTR